MEEEKGFIPASGSCVYSPDEGITNKEILKSLETQKRNTLRMMEPYQKELHRICNGIEKYKDLVSKDIIASGEDDWEWLLENSGSEGMVKHNYLTKKLSSLGLRSMGHYPEAKQTAISISIYKNPTKDNQSLEEIEKSLNTIIPFIKPIDIDGFGKAKRIGIMEKTLSEYGSYSLCIRELDKTEEYVILFFRWGSPDELKSCKTLREALEYIKENVYND